MEEFGCDNFKISIYTNKAKSLFRKAGEKIVTDKRDLTLTNTGNFFVLYDDYDVDIKMKEHLEKPENIVFSVVPRKITITVDDKKSFAQRMNGSKYAPKHFNMNEIDKLDSTKMYYVKIRGSTSCKGVQLLKPDDIKTKHLTNTVIQENIITPDLYKSRRYKIRAYIMIFKNKVYINRKFFAYVSDLEYEENISNIPQNIINSMNIIYNGECINGTEIKDHDIIFKNIIESCKDFKTRYIDVVNSITNNTFTVLGLDYVVKNDKSVYIIEINHRPNFYHTPKMSKEVDIPVLEDILNILINDNNKNTDYILI